MTLAFSNSGPGFKLSLNSLAGSRVLSAVGTCHQFFYCDPTTTSRRAARAGDNEQTIFKQDLGVQIVVQRRVQNSPYQDVDAALAELAKSHGSRLCRGHVKRNFWIRARHPVDDGWHKSACKALGTSEPYLSGSGICQKLDVTDPLLQLIGHDLLSRQSNASA